MFTWQILSIFVVYICRGGDHHVYDNLIVTKLDRSITGWVCEFIGRFVSLLRHYILLLLLCGSTAVTESICNLLTKVKEILLWGQIKTYFE